MAVAQTPPRAPTSRRLFTFSRLNNKQLSQTDLAMMASNVVLSALSILPYQQLDRHDAESNAEQERAVKMASILGFNVVRAAGRRGEGCPGRSRLAAVSRCRAALHVQDRRDGRAVLSRATLIIDIERKGLLTLVPEEVRQIYTVLESDFNPLQLCRTIAPLLEGLGSLDQASSGEPLARRARPGGGSGKPAQPPGVPVAAWLSSLPRPL